MPTKIQSAQRALKVLEFLNANNGATLRQIGDAFELTRGTAFRLVETMRDAGFLHKDPGSRHYWLTDRVLALSSGYAGEHWIEAIARPILIALGDRLHWPVRLTTLSGSSVVVRISTDFSSPFTFEKVPTGRQVGLFTTASGHVFLAFVSDEERQMLVENYRDPSSDLKHLRQDVEQQSARIRKRGYEHVRDDHTGMLATPVLAEDKVIGCVSITYFSRTVSAKECIRDFLPALQEAGREIVRLRNDMMRS